MSSDSVWQEVTTNKISVGDILRVKDSAYNTDAGKIHNGRFVQVLQISDGDVCVKTIDNRKPPVNYTKHPPHKLERLVTQID